MTILIKPVYYLLYLIILHVLLSYYYHIIKYKHCEQAPFFQLMETTVLPMHDNL